MRTLWRNAHLTTLAEANGWGFIRRGALVVDDDILRWVGSDADLPAGLTVDAEHHLDGELVTPGLVDCHTHLVYGGQRAREFELRLEGASYEEIAHAGGGIARPCAPRATRRRAPCSRRPRCALAQLMADGVPPSRSSRATACRWSTSASACAWRAGSARRCGVTVRTTFLGAHALPPEFAGRADDYIDVVCAAAARAARAKGWSMRSTRSARRIGFTPGADRRVFETAHALGLPVKLHAEQLSTCGGAALAADFGALSADHIEYLNEGRRDAMARAGTVAVLLPGAYYFLRDTKVPPIARCAPPACRWRSRPTTTRARRRRTRRR